MSVSSAQQFLIAHTHELCHTAFICMKYERWKKRSRTPSFWSRTRVARPHFRNPEINVSYWLLKRAGWIWWVLAWGGMQMYVKWPGGVAVIEVLPSFPSSDFAEKNILSHLFVVQKNIKGGNASSSMVVLLFWDTVSKRNKRQFYLRTCRTCYLLLVSLSQSFSNWGSFAIFLEVAGDFDKNLHYL